MASEDLISRTAGFAAALAAMAAAGYATIPGHTLNETAQAGVISVYVSSNDPVKNAASEKSTNAENKPEEHPQVLSSESYIKNGSGDTKAVSESKPDDNRVTAVETSDSQIQTDNQIKKETPPQKNDNTARSNASPDNYISVSKTADPVLKKEPPRASVKNTWQTKTSDSKNKKRIERERSDNQKAPTQRSPVPKSIAASSQAPSSAHNRAELKSEATPSADTSLRSASASSAIAKSRTSQTPDMVNLAVSTLRTELKRRLVYPKAAIRRELEGTVKVRFEIKAGRVKSAVITSASGEEILDESALTLALSLKGVQVIENGDLSVVIPVEYRLE